MKISNCWSHENFECVWAMCCLYSPGSQQGGVSPSWGSVSHLRPGGLGGSQPTKWPHPGLQTAVDREPVRQGTGQHHHCCSTSCQNNSRYAEFNKPLNASYVTNHNHFSESETQILHTYCWNQRNFFCPVVSVKCLFSGQCTGKQEKTTKYSKGRKWWWSVSVIAPLCLCSECGGERTQLQDGRT